MTCMGPTSPARPRACTFQLDSAKPTATTSQGSTPPAPAGPLDLGGDGPGIRAPGRAEGCGDGTDPLVVRLVLPEPLLRCLQCAPELLHLVEEALQLCLPGVELRLAGCQLSLLRVELGLLGLKQGLTLGQQVLVVVKEPA